MKIRGKNPLHVIFSALVFWRYVNTYVIISENSLTLSRYIPQANHNVFKRTVDCLKIDDISEIRNNIQRNEVKSEIKKQGIYGSYVSQEIQFIMKSGHVIAWNSRPYTKKQVYDLMASIHKENSDIVLS